MNALHILIVSLFVGDGFLGSLFTDAGATHAEIIAEGERTVAQYPRVIVSVWGGAQEEYTDENDPDDESDTEDALFVHEGRVQLEIVCREDENHCPDPLMTAMGIKAHLVDILVGRKTKGLRGIKGRQFSDGSGNYTCTRCVQKGPEGKLPSDPAFERHRVSFDVGILRLED